MNIYRLEWASSAVGEADLWVLASNHRDARRTALRLLRRGQKSRSCVRIVLTGPDGDVADRFASKSSLENWASGALLPEADPDAVPTAASEIERLRTRALAALDVVLEWSVRHKILGATPCGALRLAFDAALLGIAPPAARVGGRKDRKQGPRC